MKRAMMLVLAILLLTAAVFAGGGRQGASASGAGSQQALGKIVNGIFRYDNTVDVTAALNYYPAYMVGDPTDMWFFHWVRDKMNINFKVTPIAFEAHAMQSNLIFASGNVPDCLLTWIDLQPRSKQAILGDVEGQLYAWNHFINPDVMPNLWKAYTEEFPNLVDILGSGKGNLYGFPRMTLVDWGLSGTRPNWYRKDWFEAVGYTKPPSTVDELYDVLTKIKQQDPGKVGRNLVPYGAVIEYQGGANYFQPIWNAFGFSAGWYNELVAPHTKTGMPVFCPMEDAYFGYLQFMNKLHREGLVLPEIFTIDDQTFDAMKNNGYFALSSGSSGAAVIPAPDIAGDGWKNWGIMPALTSQYSSVAISPGDYPVSMSYLMLITKAATDLRAEALARVMDIGYNRDINYLFYYGPQKGVDPGYGKVEGWSSESGNINVDIILNDVGEGKQFANSNQYYYSVAPFGRNGATFDRRTDGSEESSWDLNTWLGYQREQIASYNRRYYTPNPQYRPIPTELEDRLGDLRIGLNDYVKSETAKFVVGTRPLTQAEFDRFKADLVRMGANEYLKPYLDAYVKP